MVQEDLAYSIKEGGQYCALWDGQGILVGVVDFIVTAERPNTSFLLLLMIGAPWRNRGFGQAVVTSLEQYLKYNHGIQRLDSTVQTNNPSGIRFWEKMGFDLSDEPRGQPDGTVTYEMTKVL